MSKTIPGEVTLGWVVKMRFRKKQEESSRGHEKTVSKTFLSEGAAGDFKTLAEKDATENPKDAVLDPVFFVTRDLGIEGA